MEFPHLGDNCSEASCNKLDFLPVECDGCHRVFCSSHMTYNSHRCPTPRLVDNQVPVCPLCGKPVPSKPGEPPDVAVGDHIDRDCQSDPAKKRRQIYNKCSLKGCKGKEYVPVVCDKCRKNFCLKHRHPQDHQCTGKPVTSNDPLAYTKRHSKQNRVVPSDFHGHMTEDEALAHALALSMSASDNIAVQPRSNSHSSQQNCNVS